MSESKRVLKWWWSWEPEKIEIWLEQMAAEGWQLTQISWNVVRFHFEKGEPQRMRYCIDYQNKQDPYYKQLFEESGWASVYSGAGWHIWRMPFTDKRPEIYSDLNSMIDRNKRVILLLYIVLVAQFPLFMLNLFPNKGRETLSTVMLCFYGVLILLFVYGFIRLFTANRKLIKRRDSLK